MNYDSSHSIFVCVNKIWSNLDKGGVQKLFFFKLGNFPWRGGVNPIPYFFILNFENSVF